MALRQFVDCPAERRVVLEQTDVLAIGVEDIGPHPGEDVQVRHQLEELFFIK